MQRPTRKTSTLLRGGIAFALVFTSLLAACDRGGNAARTGADAPASAASR